MKVKDVMTAHSLKYCSPETKLNNAAKTMKASNCGALPVVNKEKKLLGIVTDRDICLSLAQKQAKSINKITIGQIMSSKVHTVNSDDDISVAYTQMRANKIGRLPVVDARGKLKGIVSLHNLINQSIINEGNGNTSITEENLLKTIKAVTNRYIGNDTSLVNKNPVMKKSKMEVQYEES